MAIKDRHLVYARKFLVALSWKRIFMIVILAAVGIGGILGWAFKEENAKTVNRLSYNSSLVVSVSTKNEIDSIVKKSPIIVGMKVVTVNFQRNIRTDTYVFFDEPRLSDIYTNIMNNKVYDTPLFTENKINNRHILRLISGEFVCLPFKETSGYTIAPELSVAVTDVCATGIPPYHGDFSGLLTIYLTSHPSKDDIERFFLLSRDLSIKIYEDTKNAKNNHR